MQEVFYVFKSPSASATGVTSITLNTVYHWTRLPSWSNQSVVTTASLILIGQSSSTEDIKAYFPSLSTHL